MSEGFSLLRHQLPKTSRSHSSVEEGLGGQSLSATVVLSHQKAPYHSTPPSRHLTAQNPECDLHYLVSHITDRRSERRYSRREVNRYSAWKSSGGERH